MPKFKREVEGENGWSRWVPPTMKGYRIACCDCGLVHNMEFRVVKIKREEKDGSYLFKELPDEKYRVHFRAQRNNRSTANMRKKKKNG